MAIPDEGIGQDAIARWIPSEQLANGVRGFERLDGMSFGKKDVRKYELQKLAILAATRLYEREAAVGGRQLVYREIALLVTQVAQEEEMELSRPEFETVLDAAVRLSNCRQYIGEIVQRWTRGRTTLGYDDIKTARDLLNEAEQREKLALAAAY